MSDEFLKTEETITNLLSELSKIRDANSQISSLENISKKTVKIADDANRNSSEIITRANNIFDQIERAKLEVNLKLILEQLKENKRVASKNTIFLITVMVIQTIILLLMIFTKFA